MTDDNPPRVLVVDDEPANVSLLERLLEREGQDVVGLTDPREALTRFAAVRPDLVLLDLHMPHLDGFEVMRRIRGEHTGDGFLPILVLTADVATEVKHRALDEGATDFLTKPLDATEVILRVRNLLHTRDLHLRLREHNEMLEQRVRERTRELWAAVQSLEKTEADLRRAQEETIHRLASAVEFRDDETGWHIERMSHYSALLGRKAGIDTGKVEALQLATSMHDVGKIGVPDAVLLKPGPLTPEEFEVVKQHAAIGHRILGGSRAELLEMAATIAFTHHERWDGTGYPRGLAGDEIPLEGRIAAVADVFDALTSDRVYRPAFELDEAVAMMRDSRGTHLDGDLVDLLLDSMGEVLKIRVRYADERPEHDSQAAAGGLSGRPQAHAQ